MKNLIKSLAIISVFIGVGAMIAYIPVSKKTSYKPLSANKVDHEGWEYAYIVSTDTADKLYNNDYVDPSEIELTDVYIKWHNKSQSSEIFGDTRRKESIDKVGKKILPVSLFYGKKTITLKDVMDDEVDIMENIGWKDNTKIKVTTISVLSKKELTSNKKSENNKENVQFKPSTKKLKTKNKRHFLSVINGVTEETFIAKPSFKGAEISQ